MQTLVCQDCGLEWEREAKRGPKPLRCEPCKSEDRRRYYAENKESRSEYARRWYLKNREAAGERSRRYYEENSDRMREYRRRYYVQNIEKERESTQRYREENREKRREDARRYWEQNPDVRRKNRQARRARERNALDETFLPGEVYGRDGWTCGICQQPVDPDLRHPDPMSPSLDHIVPLSLGGRHSRANTQLAHLLCNIRKGAREAS